MKRGYLDKLLKEQDDRAEKIEKSNIINKRKEIITRRIPLVLNLIRQLPNYHGIVENSDISFISISKRYILRKQVIAYR